MMSRQSPLSWQIDLQIDTWISVNKVIYTIIFYKFHMLAARASLALITKLSFICQRSFIVIPVFRLVNYQLTDQSILSSNLRGTYNFSLFAILQWLFKIVTFWCFQWLHCSNNESQKIPDLFIHNKSHFGNFPIFELIS